MINRRWMMIIIKYILIESWLTFRWSHTKNMVCTVTLNWLLNEAIHLYDYEYSLSCREKTRGSGDNEGDWVMKRNVNLSMLNGMPRVRRASQLAQACWLAPHSYVTLTAAGVDSHCLSVYLTSHVYLTEKDIRTHAPPINTSTLPPSLIFGILSTDPFLPPPVRVCKRQFSFSGFINVFTLRFRLLKHRSRG